MCKKLPYNNPRNDKEKHKILCKCGCGQEIIIKPHHKYYGIPSYINYHYFKSKEYKEKRKKLHADPNSRYNSIEYRKKIAQGGRNRINTDEYREKCRIAKLGKKNPNFGKIPTHLKNIHKNWKKKDPEGYKKHQREAGKKGFLSCPRISSLELDFQRILRELNINFVSQFNYGMGFADFLIKPNLIIFVDGDFWHGNPIRFKQLSQKQRAQKRKDETQNKFLRSKGYKIVRIWEYDLKKLNDKQKKKLILNIVKIPKPFISRSILKDTPNQLSLDKFLSKPNYNKEEDQN